MGMLLTRTGEAVFQASSQNFEKQLLVSSCVSLCPSTRNSSAPTRLIFIKVDIGILFENLSINFEFRHDEKNEYFT
jgi:hypothetical protein